MIEKRKTQGFVLTELIVSMTVLGFLLIAVALSLDGARRFGDYQLTRQRCVAAADAELESIAATGKPIAEEDMGRLWPKVQITIEETSGSGRWEGLRLVRVTATSKSFNRQVKVPLARYMAEGK